MSGHDKLYTLIPSPGLVTVLGWLIFGIVIVDIALGRWPAAAGPAGPPDVLQGPGSEAVCVNVRECS